ncbi:SelT/SelW/SelH family protein [Natronorubrum daqingense]|uniref:Selenoprotein n=1 Tax=Natronorubrum daqingense TaxID=588898 RepID=A0A1N6Z1I3_9EURY|nr:Rdx family protein [Natronorubrum daqingense]APX95491.1 selenoprotein [Natronorubrum daqingense]SIR20718.1 selenoprotein W-related protein [Natronorubrum daqingense]
MTSVEIEYCVPCGFLERAEALQHALLSTFGEQLESVTLRTGVNGIFAVRVDDELVYEKSESAYDIDEIVRRVRARL